MMIPEKWYILIQAEFMRKVMKNRHIYCGWIMSMMKTDYYSIDNTTTIPVYSEPDTRHGIVILMNLADWNTSTSILHMAGWIIIISIPMRTYNRHTAYF